MIKVADGFEVNVMKLECKCFYCCNMRNAALNLCFGKLLYLTYFLCLPKNLNGDTFLKNREKAKQKEFKCQI